jgi:ATP-dependent helicase HrpB
MDEWLAPFLDGMTRLAHLSRLNLLEILRARFSYEQRSQLDLLAPTHCIVPTGSRIPLDYSSGKPVLAVRLQEMFGEANTPTIAGGKVNVVLHLLSPAHRPLAVTQDLVSFWRNAYPDVRKEMRGRYPKHHWPENPLSAVPTKRKKPTAR